MEGDIPFLSSGGMMFELDDIKDKMLEYTKKHSISHEEKMELAEDTSDEFRMDPWEVKERFREVGAPICQKPNGDLFIPEGEVGSGTSTYTSKQICQEQGGKRVGQFHTHPTPPITPSNPDLRVMQRNEDEIACIGSTYDDKAVVACFEEAESKMRGAEGLEFKRVKEGLTGKSSLYSGSEKVGEINIWDSSEPTPREILEKLPIIIEEASEHTGTPEKKIREELKKGRIPESIHRLADFSESHDELDLPVFSSEDEEKMLEEDERELTSSFNNVRIFEEKIGG